MSKGGTWIAVKRNGQGTAGMGVVLAVELTLIEGEHRRQGQSRDNLEFLYTTEVGGIYSSRWVGQRPPEVGMLVAFKMSECRPLVEGAFVEDEDPDTEVIPENSQTWFVVQRDEDEPEGFGTVVRVRMTEDQAISFERTLEPGGYSFNVQDTIEWSSAARPLPGLRVRYTHDGCCPYRPELEQEHLVQALERFDAVFGSDEP